MKTNAEANRWLKKRYKNYIKLGFHNIIHITFPKCDFLMERSTHGKKENNETYYIILSSFGCVLSYSKSHLNENVKSFLPENKKSVNES